MNMEKSYSKILKIEKKGKSDVFDFTVENTHRILANNFYTSNCSVKHPDTENFIDAKLEQGKITGANISLRIDDEFMRSVVDKKPYMQQYPVDSDSPKFQKEIDPTKIWDKVIHNAWKSAEPGILFWDNIIKESIPDCYADLGYKTTSTNPCGEIPLCPYDSCRLIAINLYSYVDEPFTPNAKFNKDLFKSHVAKAQRMMDDLIDLEIEKINSIINKIQSDPEDDTIKLSEINLWKKIMNMCIKGRRTGLGITAEGDMLAALGLKYGTPEATDFAVDIQKTLAIAAYKSSVIMAKERGAFPIYDYNREVNNPMIKRLIDADSELGDMLKKYGRRNIALLTIAPTGSVSVMTQTTSGIEPAFMIAYKRRKKINPNDKSAKSMFTDSEGVQWEEYSISHPKFIEWLRVNGYDIQKTLALPENELNEIIKLTPYYGATSDNIDWVEKVRMQGAIQKWVDHSISVTVNIPAETTEQVVNDIYTTAWESGCKGITIYREGSRNGVLVSDKEKKEKEKQALFTDKDAPRRPKRLKGEIMRFQNNLEKWIAVVGLYEGRPYEIFTGKLENGLSLLPSSVKECEIVKNKMEDGSSRYDMEYLDENGVKQVSTGLSHKFDPQYWNYAKLISGLLRHQMPMVYVYQTVNTLNLNDDNLNTWKAGLLRVIKRYIKDGEKTKGKCTVCGSEHLEFIEGCLTCMGCGSSKCS